MEETKSLKSILNKLQYPDDAQVMKQLIDQSLTVKTRMGRIRRKILVLSGKGGVGKSMTTVNMALAFARIGLKVGILDVDLNGPCVPKMLGMSDEKFTLTPEGALPPIGPYGMKVASMEFFLKKDTPLQWKGAMDLSPIWLGMVEMNVIREFLGDIIWGDLDILLVDLPPGAAADKPPAIVGYIPELDGAIVVTTPSEVTGDVVKRSIIYSRDVGIKVLGIIENMSGFLCPDCHTESELFEGNSDQLCQDLKVQLLGKIPFSRKMSRACDQGKPLNDESEPTVQKFNEIALKLAAQLKFKMAVQ
ncbi:MAG: P-loop NTPase [Nitrospirae bacterium]|nr:P-loop NTPase [Nitrospirota bacterium]MBI3594941.1 P-loop NTPase [Nitrospirota bacterium]